MQTIRKSILAVFLAVVCLESYSQVQVFSKSHLQSQNWEVVLDGYNEPFLYYKFQGDTVRVFLGRSVFYMGDGPYYLSDTPDTAFVSSKVGVKTQGRYLVCRVHREAQELIVMKCISRPGNEYVITHKIGDLRPPVSARFLVSTEFLEE